jgi:hypothetical protein
VSTLESRIDDLYRLALPEFTGARNALAKTVSKEEAKLVKRLAKPTTSAWAANQVYWRARPLYDQLLRAGVELRAAQLAALQGRDKNVRPRSDAHRKALSEAVAEATRLAAEQGVRAGSDELTRMFEAVSLVPEHPERPGRLTEAHRLTGFEGLQGMTPAPRGAGTTSSPTKSAEPKQSPAKTPTADRQALAEAARKARDDRREQVRLARDQRRQKAAIASAERAVELARTAEMKARGNLDRAQRTLGAAEAALRAARGG